MKKLFIAWFFYHRWIWTHINYFLGHFHGTFSQNVQFGVWLKDLYDSTNEKIVGIYGIFRGILFVREPEVVKSVLIKDFPNFLDQDIHSNSGSDQILDSRNFSMLHNWISPLRLHLEFNLSHQMTRTTNFMCENWWTNFLEYNWKFHQFRLTEIAYSVLNPLTLMLRNLLKQ